MEAQAGADGRGLGTLVRTVTLALGMMGNYWRITNTETTQFDSGLTILSGLPLPHMGTADPWK